MTITTAVFPDIINAINAKIISHAEEVTALDQVIGDGDHIFNLQRGLQELQQHAAEIATLSWSAAWQKIGMLLMSSVGGASGSLYATLFLNLAKNSKDTELNLPNFANLFALGIVAMKQRGKSDVGEKTMLDVLVPVSTALLAEVNTQQPLAAILKTLCHIAADGAESTRNMLASKGRASFVGERSLGHIDAGARTAQLMIEAIAEVLLPLGA